LYRTGFIVAEGRVRKSMAQKNEKNSRLIFIKLMEQEDGKIYPRA
jgi:hypothetical protein